MACSTIKNIWSRHTRFWPSIDEYLTRSSQVQAGHVLLLFLQSRSELAHVLAADGSEAPGIRRIARGADMDRRSKSFTSRSIRFWAKCCPRLDEHTTLLVLSDHGFAPYYRSFNLNTWLLHNGYIKLKAGANLDDNEPFCACGLEPTRAYGLGLNGLYLNLRGRENRRNRRAGAGRRVDERDSSETAQRERPEKRRAGDHPRRSCQRSLSRAACA